MRTRYLIPVCAWSLLSVATVLAEPPLDRDFKQLQTEHTKAIAAANKPINRRYQTGLEQLFRRAMQVNDLETAVRARDELKTLGVTTAAVPTPSATPAGSSQSLAAFLAGTSWSYSRTPNGASEPMTFGKDGKVTLPNGAVQTWKVLPGNKISITNVGTGKLDEARQSFEIDHGDGTFRYGKLIK
jgi:hypothetical protein